MLPTELFHSSDGSPCHPFRRFVLFLRRLKKAALKKSIYLLPRKKNEKKKKNQNRNDIKREEKIKNGAQHLYVVGISFLLEPVPGDGLCMTVCCVFENGITKAKHMFLMYTGAPEP